ncbi:MAG: hypothetical protein AB7V13_23705 [Pseudorhodoplanes sp.]|uniref:hypothetical protein n=1 Tax=Pseudorhodoplanes sp. TaxID=1934341 RepID=UPI003D1518BA
MPDLSSNGCKAVAQCRSCGTPVPTADPIFVKFQRCYYCGRHHPLGGKWTLTTVPVILAAMVGLLAIWWTQMPL